MTKSEQRRLMAFANRLQLKANKLGGKAGDELELAVRRLKQLIFELSNY